jgi:hypothetical protein
MKRIRFSRAGAPTGDYRRHEDAPAVDVTTEEEYGWEEEDRGTAMDHARRAMLIMNLWDTRPIYGSIRGRLESR